MKTFLRLLSALIAFNVIADTLELFLFDKFNVLELFITVSLIGVQTAIIGYKVTR